MSRFFKALFILNCVSLIASLFYVVMPGPSVFWNGYGLVLILTLTGNILAAMLTKQHAKTSLTYLITSSIGLIAVMILNTVTSLTPSNDSSRSLLSIGSIVLLLIIGTTLTGKAFKDKKKLTINETFQASQSQKAYRKTKISVLILLSFLLLIGELLAFIMLTNVSVSLIETGLSPYSLFYSLIFLSISGIIVKLLNVKKHPIITYTMGAIGISLYLLFALPFLTIPSMLNEAEENYTKAFGEEWTAYEDTVSKFRDVPISIPAFFFGSLSDDYIVQEDILFYEGSEGVDAGIELKFDVYSPPEDAKKLPGDQSVLIRIHGGGWGTGDKGVFNFSQINKYFASKGYVVFDVQYGLDDHNQSALFLSGPDEVYGQFSIDDMVRHLGIFTTYLADNKDDYAANLDSVFISGGSSGGQLANAVALASSSEKYTELIDPRLSVNGLIPLYPANNLSQYRNIGGKDELIDPALLVEENSPPALIFQGDKDGIVDPQVARNFRDAYLKKGNDDAAIIWMPYGAHVSDIYFSGFYNQTFMYYMERFMYQYQ